MRPVAAAMLVLALVGCAATPPPTDRHFRIELMPAPEPLRIPGGVVVDAVIASGVIHELPVLYSRPETPLQLEQHPFAYWARPPAEMVADALRRRLGAARSADADCRLRARLLRFEQRLSDTEPAGIVELALELNCRGRPAHSARLVESHPAEGADPGAAAIALSRALESLLDRWAASVIRETRIGAD